MVSLITKKRFFLRQDAKSLHTRNLESDALGHPTGNATASEFIVDTLEFFPHNYQMPQLSSTDRLIMAAKDITDALHNPHPEVPFARVGDDTILALTDLAAIFKLKLRQTPSPTPQAAPPKVTLRPCLAQ
jgi:hypothetical protein